MATQTPVTPDTLVAIKINVDGYNRRFKLPLKDLGAQTFHAKLRTLLNIPDDTEVIFERYSDSAADFITLDPNNQQVFKQLYRAAKAKLKLRLKLTVIETETKAPVKPKPAAVEDEVPATEQATEKAPEPAPQKAPSPAPIPPQYFNPYGANCYRTPAPQPPQPIPVYRSSQDFPTRGLTLRTKPVEAHKEAVAAAIPAPPAPSPAPVVPAKCPMSIPAVCSSNPIAAGSVAREKWYAELAALTMDRQNALRSNRMSPASTRQPTMHHYSVYCNQCSAPIPDEHYHCNTCDDGDYDLCPECVDCGKTCLGDNHWMIKRNVKNGKVISSTTEKLPPRQIPTNDSKATLVPQEDDTIIPAPKEEKAIEEWVRTCNSCLIETKEDSFVTCKDCPDFDLCIDCHVSNKHGHHPQHAFAPATMSVRMTEDIKRKLQPGRGVRHQAICDGCDKFVFGVRHKCLDCPDWDYCSTCFESAPYIHKGHRFVPIYDPVSYPVSLFREETHIKVYCDGPLCRNKYKYIQGVRYKCAVCHDTDFCASCEASPVNLHNRTHPVIKIKTPIRSVSVTTMGDHDNGRPLPVMGDRALRRCGAGVAPTASWVSANAATQVQTVAETKPAEKPVEVKKEAEAEKEVEVKEEPKEMEAVKSVEAPAPVKVEQPELIANFIRDTVQDGTTLAPGTVFEQTWYLRNAGKTSWPAGCSVKFIGGDNMCATDPEHPASVHELVSAAESTTCYTEVAPGQEHGFTVLMRTPAKHGKVVSYWRLTGPNGYKFGHRLWCDITVAGTTPEIKEEKVEAKAAAPVEALALSPAPVEAPVAEKEVEVKQESTESSQLSFPKLAKESPEQSVHEAEAAVPEEFEANEDDFHDFTSVDHEVESGSEDFLTDEEYDILDASDEEDVAASRK